jgi:hypothetical protein
MHDEWLAFHSWPLWGYGRIVNPATACPLKSLTYLWSFNSVSWKLCECTSDYRFWGLTLNSWPLWWYSRIVNSFMTCPMDWHGVFDIPVNFELCILKTMQRHVEFEFFEWLTLYSRSLWGYGRITNPSTTGTLTTPMTCPVESLIVSMYLWSFNSVSWKLCECTLNLRFLINPLFLTLLGVW